MLGITVVELVTKSAGFMKINSNYSEGLASAIVSMGERDISRNIVMTNLISPVLLMAIEKVRDAVKIFSSQFVSFPFPFFFFFCLSLYANRG